MAEQWKLGVCSWSLQVKNVPELERLLGEVGVGWTQIALGDPHHASWDESDEEFIKKVREASFAMSGAMLGFPGEDYTSPQTIRETGGFGDPALREKRLEILRWGVKKTKALGLDIMTAHAGFIPAVDAPGRQEFLDCLRRALDSAAESGITIAFETGQETAELLRATLDELKHERAKVNFDPANMLLYDKGDPLDAVRILGDALVHVHAKDARRPTTPGQWGEEVPLGEGTVDIPAFLNVLREVGFTGAIAVEREVGNQAERIRDISAGVALLKKLI